MLKNAIFNTCLDSYLGVHAHWRLNGKPGNSNNSSGGALAGVVLHGADVASPHSSSLAVAESKFGFFGNYEYELFESSTNY